MPGGVGAGLTATQAAGQNNNVGGASSLNQPWGGSGMSMGNAGKILNPLGIGGGGGMDKGAAEAFFDPAGIDSGSYGLNLFGHRQAADPTGGVPSVLPNLGITPQYYDPNSFKAPSTAGGYWNAMAQRLAGPVYKPTIMGAAPMRAKQPGGNSGPVHGQMTQPSIAALLARFGTMGGR